MYNDFPQPPGTQLQPDEDPLKPTDSTDFRSRDSVDYGNGVIGKNLGNGKWQYDALGRSYDDLLGDDEVASQLALKKYRDQYGGGVAEDDLTAGAQMRGEVPLKSGRDGALQSISNAYAGGGGGGGGGASAYTQSLRDILKQQMDAASQPVSANDPGIREVLAGQRLSSQRSAERQQAMNAERLAGMGLADSGATETGRQGIEQARGERDTMATGQVLSQELGQRRQQMQNALQLALQSGDLESARDLQMQLAKMQESQGQDQLAYNYSALNQQGNLQALLALLGQG